MYQGGGERMMMRQKEKQTMEEGTERARGGGERLRFRKMNREPAFKARRMQRGCPRG